jgi:hypothetical protein
MAQHPENNLAHILIVPEARAADRSKLGKNLVGKK